MTTAKENIAKTRVLMDLYPNKIRMLRSEQEVEVEISRLKKRLDNFLVQIEAGKRQYKDVLAELKKYGINSLEEAVQLVETLEPEIEKDKARRSEIVDEIEEILNAYEQKAGE